ncbi:aromatic acid exporter family protein [Paenibacillus sp. N1-5-1-14]|uniref:aromatic acid exporter family protein n=1 Tax=Paenibacillus radicibacter TaxID=2972488 RepID=UPI00215915F5|nr:aromatic acid exporter family protein [Paenibacillus radicibacter]MCR8641627.1 aromatic acid exporter family protein [Paenibacillus radicibacter]
MKYFPFIGVRILKTAAAVFVSILVAQLCGLGSPVSAGLLAILGVQVTKKKGLLNVYARIGASVLSIIVGAILLSTFGFHVWVLSIYVLLTFPIMNRLKFSDGIITGCVVMFHMFNAHVITMEVIINELLLLLVGFGSATLINIIYMPPTDKELQQYKNKLEELFSLIFMKIGAHLRDQNMVWDGAELLQVNEVCDKGSMLARKAVENTLFFGSPASWELYFFMRSEQLEMINRMVDLVAQVYQSVPHGELLADIFDELSQDVKSDYYVGRSEEDLATLARSFKSLPLPQTREEFEVRSALLQLIRELKSYLNIAKRQKNKKELMRSS